MDKYIGIDLGTSNSAIACFNGESVELVVNAHGEISTPSIVRISSSGTTVGIKARRFLEKDALNTHREFKRLMGTTEKTSPDSQGMRWTAEQLSAEVLKSLISDVESQCNFVADKAVITVPALFELPQSKATAEAGRIAGLDRVELLPEPVASALAAGWDSSESSGSWLVFDLGGGTFDASLLESRDGLLRVVAHDGDNFLGGRDIDRKVVDWLLSQLESSHAITIDEEVPGGRTVLNTIFQQVEKAKIQLSRVEQTLIELDFEWLGQEVIEDIRLNRVQLEELAAPIVDRAISICLRLLQKQGLDVEQLQRVVLVGGPAHMPIVKDRVTANLAEIAAGDEDPMALVAKGAALYSGSVGLGCVANTTQETEPNIAPNLWMQYPSVSSELTPLIMGRVIEATEVDIWALQIKRTDGNWISESIELDDEGIFSAQVQLLPNKSNTFQILAVDKKSAPVEVSPSSVSIMQGLTLSDPPLSRSIGVALANGNAKVFIERGTPLPAKRTFIKNTVDTLTPDDGKSLNIPIVQGERVQARFCRKVGNLVISSSEIDKPLNLGAPIEITIEVDKGGNMSASAMLVDHNKTIPGVAELVMPSAEPDSLRISALKIQNQLTELQQEAFRNRDESLISRLDVCSKLMLDCQTDIKNCDGNTDLCMRLQRNLMEIEAELEEIQCSGELEELLDECSSTFLDTQYWVDLHGNPAEKQMLSSYHSKIQHAFERQRKEELQRLIEQMSDLRYSAYRKAPSYWEDMFEYYASRINDANNLKQAQSLVKKGRSLIEKDQKAGLQQITTKLAQLLPSDAITREMSHGSGIH